MSALSDLLATLVVVGPGFLSVEIAYALYGPRKEIGSYDKSIRSLLVGAVINASVFLSSESLAVVDAVTNPELLLGPDAISRYAAFTSLGALVLFLGLRGRVISRLNAWAWRGASPKLVSEDVWDGVLPNARAVLIESRGWRYYGELRSMGMGDEKREIELVCTHRIRFDASTKQEVQEDYKYTMVFPEGSIDNITIVEWKPSAR